MAENQPSLGWDSKVGPSYDFTILSHDYDNEWIESDCNNKPFITKGELGPLPLDDNDGANNIFIHIVLHRFESSETFDAIDGVELDKVLDGTENNDSNMGEVRVVRGGDD